MFKMVYNGDDEDGETDKKGWIEYTARARSKWQGKAQYKMKCLYVWPLSLL